VSHWAPSKNPTHANLIVCDAVGQLQPFPRTLEQFISLLRVANPLREEEVLQRASAAIVARDQVIVTAQELLTAGSVFPTHGLSHLARADRPRIPSACDESHDGAQQLVDDAWSKVCDTASMRGTTLVLGPHQRELEGIEFVAEASAAQLSIEMSPGSGTDRDRGRSGDDTLSTGRSPQA
jgi:hypothetical protein